MSRTLLIECSPRRPSDGTVRPLRLCWKALGAPTWFGQQWEPVVQQPPSFEMAIGFDGRNFGASPTPQVGELVCQLSDRIRDAAGLIWDDAAITIRAASWPRDARRLVDADFPVVWQGRAEAVSSQEGLMTVRLLDAGQLLRTPLAALKWGSTGIALLDSADARRDRVAGSVVPLAYGRVLSIPGLLVDRLNNIWLFSARPATSVEAFYDGGAAFDFGVARSSLALLQANVPARGRVDFCLDAAGLFLARPWSPPTYPFTADATFGSQSAGDIASAIVGGRLPFRSGAVSAFNATIAAACGIYVDDETTVAGVLDRLVAGLGAIWKLRSEGTLDLRRLSWGTPVLSIPSSRRSAPSRIRIIAPTARRSLGYARNNRPHSEGEIAKILLAEDLAYADGTAIETLKPAGPGATRNVVTYAATAPPSPIDGDLWVDISGTFAVFRLRVSGTWQTGANALTAYNALSGRPVALADINTTESSKLAGIAAGATRNVVTYSATAPASPIDGDLWVDISGTFAVFRLRVSGVWQTGANALTAYNALSGRPVALADINTTESSKLAGIQAGATVGAPAGTMVGSIPATAVVADWSGVEDFTGYASVTDVQQAWAFGNPAAVVLANDGNMSGGRSLNLSGPNNGASIRRIPYSPEDLYRVRARFFVENPGVGNSTYLGFIAYDAVGNQLTGANSGLHHYPGGAAATPSGGFHTWEGYFRGRASTAAGNVGGVAPDPSSPTPALNGTVSVAPLFLALNGGTGGEVRLDWIEISKVEDLTPLPSRPWLASDFQARGQVVTDRGRSWVARVAHTNTRPPDSNTGNSTWGLLAGRATSLAEVNAAEGAKLAGIESGATGSDNMIPNADLRDGSVGWTLSSGTTRVALTAGGPLAFAFNTTTGAGDTTYYTASIPVSAGRTLYLSLWAYLNAAVPVTFLVQQFDALGNNIGTPGFSLSFPTLSWTQREVSFTVPSNCVSVRPLILVDPYPGGAITQFGGMRLSYTQGGATRNLPRGAWTSGVAYVVGDTVTFGGSSYTATVAHTASGANQPPNGSFWQVHGAQGPAGVSAPPVASLGSGGGQLDPVRLTHGQTVTVAAELYLNAGGSAGTCSLQIQISESGLNSWSVMSGGSVTSNLPTSEPVELVVAGATFTNATGTPRLYDIRAVSVRNGRSVNQPVSGMRVI